MSHHKVKFKPQNVCIFLLKRIEKYEQQIKYKHTLAFSHRLRKENEMKTNQNLFDFVKVLAKRDSHRETDVISSLLRNAL